jgi:WNK lysine deficient protein kinase
MASDRKYTMATSDDTSSLHTTLNHVELGTDPTGEGKKSESSFSKAAEGIEEGGSTKTLEKPLNITNSATEAKSVPAPAPPSLTTTITPSVETEPRAPEVAAPLDLPVMKVNETVETKGGDVEAGEEKKVVLKDSPSVQDNRTEDEVRDVVVQAGESTVSMPATTQQQPMMDVEIQRSKSDGDEVDAVVPAELIAPATPSGSIGSSRIQAASVDEASRLQDLLSSPEGNNQIVERSPGERYLRFSEKLGSGASKDVYRAYDTEEGIEVAWNVVHLAGVPKNERNRIVNEVRLLERLHHQNIISFHGSWINREQQQVNFVTEILSSGTLKSFINKVQVIRWKIAKRWAVQILKGLEYLHSQDPPVIHRDLKCENIFINGTSGDLRIGDLGLSTVHRNGKALSVLGTPEFMAPDMYEEESYDEKVDIYAFGMCLLEIFTKEIPYQECNNPAQIYKKVTRGAPPDSLCRLQSTHARKFIELCLGYINDDGKYIRPSAKELLDHPFLVKRSVDDEEVEVDPPLQEQTIIETGTKSNGRSTESRGTNANTNTSASTAHSQNMTLSSNEFPPTIWHNLHQNSLDEDESDRFEEMPDSEVNNMKKVKVMMGRGEELKEEDDVVEDVTHNSKRSTIDLNSSIEVGSMSSLQNVQQNNDTNGQKLHYLVAAAVIEENEQNNSYQQQQPYHDDILKLVITLPVEGQTQNVQFDFHLVEDDPIQVAKEMVAELGIPEEAVLEISETVSGLARVARTKKHKFHSAKAQQNPGHMISNSLMGSRPNATSQPQVGQTAVAQQQPQQHMTQGMMQPTNQQQPMQDYIPSQQQQLQQPSAQNIPQQSLPLQEQQPMQDYIPSQQQQLQQSSAQNIQQPIPQQSLPLQDQSVGIHGQQIIENNQIPSQMQHMQPQRASIQSADSESHRQTQIPYVQAGIEMSSQMEAPNHNHQRQQNQRNGEYHHQGHVSSETNQARAPYGQSPVPPPNPPILMPSISSQSNRSQIPPQQSHGTLDASSIGSGGSYPQAAPNQIQSQGVQYPPNLVQQPSGHVSQSGASAQQTMTSSLQPPQHLQNQQMHGDSQGLGQGYTQHQQLQPSMQRAQSLTPQQQQLVQPVQQIPNIPQQQQQHMQNVVQQQPPMQLQMNRQSSLPQQLQQPVTTQQRQIQQGISQQMDHHHQQQPMAQQHSSLTQNQQQQHHQSNSLMSEYQAASNQVPPHGQRIATGANSISLSLPQDIPNTADYVPVAHQNAATHLRIQEGSVASTMDSSTTTNNRLKTTSLEKQQEDNPEGESMGVLEGLSIDTSGEDEPFDEVYAAELRKLDEDFQNNLKRAKKVFVNRMDNLQRTQVQREARHQKTLEQHHKDRTAFEKRLQQEEIEQNRRIEQLQIEWDKRREEVRLQDKD